MSLAITYDMVADAAYVRLSSNKVQRTVEFGNDVMVDLDEHNVAVGIELIDLQASIPFSDLQSRFHVHSDVIDQLRVIWPGMRSGLTFTHGNDGRSTPVRTLDLAATTS
jgi:uncharacterized protein YuzE